MGKPLVKLYRGYMRGENREARTGNQGAGFLQGQRVEGDRTVFVFENERRNE
jgi:hypothetical protein